MKSLKGRLIGGEDQLCEGAMAVLAILSSSLVNICNLSWTENEQLNLSSF
jgi:hypothetical protein